MIIGVYSPNLWARPTGVVWWDDSDHTVRSDFAERSDKILAMDELIGATNRIQFETKVAKLAARTPWNAVWGSADISISPHEYLSILQRGKSA